jgi:hypothetical protein
MKVMSDEKLRRLLTADLSVLPKREFAACETMMIHVSR